MPANGPHPGPLPQAGEGARAVAMVFDRYLQNDNLRERFSRII